MENKINKLLTRQIRRHFGSFENIPDDLKGFISDINSTYENFEDDVNLLQNSIEISSQELRVAFQKHKEDAEAQKETINKIKEAIQAIKHNSPNNTVENGANTSDSNYLFDSLIKLIEERKYAEEEIIKLSLAVEQNPASIVITDINGNIEYVNPKFCDLTGYKKEEAIGQNPRILKSETASKEFYKNMWDTILSGKEWKGEFRNSKKNGELYWELASISAVRNSSGEIVNFLAIKEDITERKQVTEALKESEKKYKEVVENIKEVIFQTDTEGLWLFLNNAWEEITGFSVEESLGQLFVNFVHPDDRQRNMDLFEPLILRKKDYCRHQIRYLTKDGGFRWIEVFARLGLNEKDEITGTYGTLQDITERKLAEEALQTKTSLLEAQTDATIDAILVIDTNQKRVLINQRAIELFNIPQHILDDEDDSILLKHVVDMTKYPEKFLEKVIYLYDHNKEISQDEIEFKNGMVLDRYSAPVLGKNGTNYGRIWTFRDITKSKQAEEEIRRHTGLISSLLDSIPDIIFYKDVNGVYLGGNPAFAEFTGRSAKEIHGITDYDIFDKEIADSFILQDKQLMESRKPVHNDLWITYPDGRKVLVDTLKTPYLGPDGELIGVLGISRDITERKQAEATLQNERNLFRTIIDLIPDAVYVKDNQGRKIIANPKEVEFAGVDSENELIGKTDFDLYTTTESSHSLDQDLLILQSGKSILDEENTLLNKKGGFYFISGSKVPFYDIHGKITGLVGITHDITERKRAEEALHQSNKKWEAIIAASPDGIGMVSFDGRLEFMSAKLARMYGYSIDHKEEYLGRTIFDFIDPSNHKLLADNFHKLLEGEAENKITEYQAIKKDNSRFYVDVNSTVLLDSKGNPSSILFIERDITERKMAEDALHNERALFRTIIDLIPDAVYVKDTQGQKVLANPKDVQFAGKESEDELIGKTDSELYPTEQAKYSFEEDILVLQSGKSILNAEGTLIDKEGRLHSLLVSKVPLYDVQGQITGLVGVTHDITERKYAEEELKRVSTRLALATLAGGVGVWDLDIENNILIWDDQMFALYGIEKNSINNAFETWLAVIHPDDAKRANDEIQMAIRGEKEFDTEYQICWPDGSIHNIRALATVQHDNSGNPLRMIGTNWDITEQKKTEAVLLKARYEAELANKSKSVFLANMSHEIRTPLNAIIGFSQLMNRDKHLTDQQKEYNLSIIRAGEHLLSLINDILELSKMEAGRLELNPTNVDLYALFSDIQMLFKEPAQAKHLQFIFETATDLPQYVIVDDNKLRRIFINLIGNALKFTEEGGIAVRARVDKMNDKTSKLIVEIQDSGHGISEDELDKLFKHFVQTSSGIKNSSGTGLGLALSRELAILMGGDITVTSEVGKGSVFTFQVEIQEGKVEDSLNIINKRVVGIDKKQDEYRILVVDDKEENLQVVVRLLNMVGFETKEAVNGIDAIAKFEEWNPHLVLMDLRMPVMDGYEASRRIKLTEKGKHIPIIALTASSFEDERKKTFALGMQGHIRKPFRENELFSTIGNVLGIKYIYEDDSPANHEKYLIDDLVVDAAVANLPADLVSQMLDAVSVADLDLLIELIQNIDTNNLELAKHLMSLANNYDYDYLQKILSKKETE